MTTPTHSRCRRSPLATSLPLVLLAAASPGVAPAQVDGDPATATGIGSTPASPPAQGPQTLYLEVSINHARNRMLARFLWQDGELLASPASLRALGLRLPAETPARGAGGMIALRDISGASVHYDSTRQQLSLQVPVALLDQPTHHLRSPPLDARLDDATSSPGALLNYALYAQRGSGTTTLSGYTELRVFGLGAGTWSTTLASSYSSDDAAPASKRLDSYWQLDLPAAMLTLTIGDAVTGALDWTRATRIGGIRLARNFSLQPYRVTTPLASFAGDAVLPSTVDLYIEGIRQTSQQVPPGHFQLDSTPSLNGAGQARLVITDINGQRQVIGISLYGTPALLQAGLSDGTLDLGVLRQDYGLRSFAYRSQLMGSASLRHGLTDALTLEAHAEASTGIRMAGFGMATLLGQRGGVLSLDVAGSRAGSRDGYQYGLGYQWNSPHLALSLNTQRHGRHFRDVAAVQAQASLPLRTDQAFIGISTLLGQFGTSYVAQRYPASPASRYASLSWSRSLSGSGLLSISASRDLTDRGGDAAFVYWSLPLGRQAHVASSSRHDRGGDTLAVEASRSVSADTGGWGWRAQANVGGSPGGLAELTRMGRFGQWSAGVDRIGGEGSPLAYASADGALAWLGGRLQPMRRVDEAFALVSTSGVPGVPVQLENRAVGLTDANGLLLINRLEAWQRNLLSVDPQDLPADMQLGSTRIEVVPAGRSGTHVAFAMRRSLAVQFGVRDRLGHWIDAGTLATLEAPGLPTQTTVVGHEGRVYLLDPPAHGQLRIRVDGRDCTAALPIAPVNEGRINLGDVTCQ